MSRSIGFIRSVCFSTVFFMRTRASERSCWFSRRYTNPREMMSGDLRSLPFFVLMVAMMTNIPSSASVWRSRSTTSWRAPTVNPSTRTRSFGAFSLWMIISVPFLISMMVPLSGTAIFSRGNPFSIAIYIWLLRW